MKQDRDREIYTEYYEYIGGDGMSDDLKAALFILFLVGIAAASGLVLAAALIRIAEILQ